jgi:predicted RNase H-like nuclease
VFSLRATNRAILPVLWRTPRTDSVMLGDLGTRYMVIPASPDVRAYLMKVARLKGVPMDGVVPV